MKMEPFAKTKVLHRMLCGILGSSLTGCDLPPDPDALKPSSSWTGVPCNDDDQMDLLDGLNETEAIDGMLLYGLGVQASYIQEAGGTRCGNATDVELCNETVDSMLQYSSSNALVLTQGDVVQVLVTEEEVKSFLGQLDNPEKVFGWMHTHGMRLSCNFDNSAVVSSENGEAWMGVYTEITQDCAPVVRERVRVNINVSDWSITEIARAEIKRSDGVCIGRKPPGELHFNNARYNIECDSLGIALARHAAYEAASVVAFLHLKMELELLGAPQHLLERIEKAADDERRHTLQVALLAKRYSQEAESFHVEPTEIRDLETIAIDNMQEGCIGETWGALVGLYQAETAQDLVIAETMRHIALDEVEHASLSWAIHDWLFPLLEDDSRLRVTQAKQKALDKLMVKAKHCVNPKHQLLAGLPGPYAATELATKLVKSLVV